MGFEPPPSQVAYRHRDAREGFEIGFFEPTDAGLRIEGITAAVEDEEPWVVEYVIELDPNWTTRRARVSGRSASGRRAGVVDGDGSGHWSVDGVPAPHLDGCLDVDLESSALTNALPIHRLALEIGERSDAPAVHVRALDLAVERLEQSYERVADQEAGQSFEYESPAFGFAARLVYDRCGLVLDYPGIAVRAA